MPDKSKLAWAHELEAEQRAHLKTREALANLEVQFAFQQREND